MSLEIVCPSCRTHLIAELHTVECYACGKIVPAWDPGPRPSHSVQPPPTINSITSKEAERVVRFLRGLVFDGELSGDEVWCLATFLNQQPREALEQWPANVLVPKLQNAFEDGELTETEMSDLATTLVEIEQEWINRFAPRQEETRLEAEFADTKPDRETRPDLSSAPHRPILPVVDYVVTMQSDGSEGGYTVNLGDHTCTCADWAAKRRRAPAGDFQRVCKHIARAFQSLELNDPMFEELISDCCGRGKGTFPSDDWIVENVNGKAVLYGFSAGSPWVNVFAPVSGGEYERFGFNREERRWSYGESPRGFTKFFRQRFGR